ncbi:putative lysin [Gordonia phage GMA2]|uniref:Putative lysin n=1 Tax=Gordonia phage GMA2 TaxID=1647283 RepID=A0A0K0N6W4_9CAUD|nr:putative lysin [Gordonia phage GMA2]AKJ72575.1 putative lysin [Gordonia phage GMA2]
MSDASDVVANSKQLGVSSTWGKSPRQLANEYNPDAKSQWARPAIEKAALELGQRYPSRSAFRDSDKPIDTMAGLTINIDGHLHEFMTVYYAVELGHEPSIALLRKHKDKSDIAAAALKKIDGK